MARPDVGVMRELLARVEVAEGPDRRLDYEIFTAFATPGEGNPWDPAAGHFYTASIDAAVALLERTLPRATWTVAGPSDHPGRNRAAVTASSLFRPMPTIVKGCATPGLNLVAALLTALIAAEDQAHG